MPDRSRPTRDEDALRRFVEHTAMTLADWGFPRMAARVLMAMFSADEEALTAADLAARLDASPAAISGALRYLTHIGLMERQPVPGSRRDVYVLLEASWYEVMAREREWLGTFVGLTEDGVKAAGGPATRAGARLDELAEFFRFMQAELKGIRERWQAQRGRHT